MSILNSFGFIGSKHISKIIPIQDRYDPFGDGSGLALYKFDNNALDTGGNYNGTWGGTEAYDAGVINDCASFNGSSYIETNSGVPTGSSDFSVSLWFSVNIIDTSGDNRFLLSQGTNATDESFGLAINNTNIRLVGYADDTDFSGFTVEINTWYFLTLTRVGDVFTLYINNINISSLTKSISIGTKFTLWFGLWHVTDGDYQYFLDGNIDHARLFNRALTTDEISILYDELPIASNYDPFKDGSGLALYRLDSNALDMSGNYNGIWSGTEAYTSGAIGDCASFNGSSYIAMGDWLSTVSSVGKMSFTYWIQDTDTSDQNLWSTDSLTSANSVLISGVNFQYWDANSSHYQMGDVDISDGLFHFICVNIDTDNNLISYYLDNSLVDSYTIASGSSILNSSDMSLGRRSGSDFYVNGNIDHVRIFNKALTTDEISILYGELPVTDIVVDPEFDIFGNNSEIAMYRLDNNAIDGSGRHNGLWASGTEAYSTGVLGNCAVFDGTDMGANTYNSGIHLDGTVTRDKTVFSVSCWVKGSGIIIQSDYYPDADGGYATGWGLHTDVIKKTLSTTSMKVVDITPPSDIDTTFHHYVFNIDHYGDAVVYIDNVLSISGDISGDIFYNGQYYADTGENIGSSYHYGPFTGSIDHIRIFNRLLTTNEIDTLYNEGI